MQPRPTAGRSRPARCEQISNQSDDGYRSDRDREAPLLVCDEAMTAETGDRAVLWIRGPTALAR